MASEKNTDHFIVEQSWRLQAISNITCRISIYIPKCREQTNKPQDRTCCLLSNSTFDYTICFRFYRHIISERSFVATQVCSPDRIACLLHSVHNMCLWIAHRSGPAHQIRIAQHAAVIKHFHRKHISFVSHWLGRSICAGTPEHLN